MRFSDLQLGATYSDGKGNHRQILVLSDDVIQYRITLRSKRCRSKYDINIVTTKSFQRWAKELLFPWMRKK